MTRTWTLALALGAMSLSACDEQGEGGDGGDTVPCDAQVIRDAAPRDGGPLPPIPGSGECAWERGERPTAELPPTRSNRYELELERWAIANDRRDPVETRARMNEAIAWAKGEGYDHIVVPPGTYLVGEPTNDVYAAGIELPGGITFELSEGAVLEMAPNDRHNYCVISVDGNDEITIRGGEIRGDRADHTYAGGTAHDEGHGVCVWTAVSHVLIEGMELHELTGDGVLIVGRRESDGMPEAPSTHITIRDNDIHHNRRQGVSIVGAHHVVVERNHIHHIEGTAPQFGVDIEGAGRTDRDILISRNVFDHNAGGDIVTSTGRNVWIESNTMTQCQTDADGVYDPSLPCELEEQVDGPIVIWKETDNVIVDNVVRMSMRTVNGHWGIIGYTRRDGPTRENPVGNYIARNVFHDAGIHMVHNSRTVIADNTLYEGMILGLQLSCTRLENNRINRTARENYKLWHVAGVAEGNVLNRTEGFPVADDIEVHFPMADDAPYRNSSPVFW
ncbi:MAG: right-handed parallel beta-helix repeat-containing protein [Myxococcota bacterium]|nr:right-handed parallel beta-helix repeat-containing protein [Myxococcota bacterium]